MAAPPSGEQFEIRHGDQRATIVEVGGGVREYVVGDSPVLDPYSLDAICDGEHGTPLIPWPNRLADGTYRFDDTEYVVPLTEPEKHNAIHGFLARRSWQPIRTRDQLEWSWEPDSAPSPATPLPSISGWPTSLETEVWWCPQPLPTSATRPARTGPASTPTCHREPAGSMTASSNSAPPPAFSPTTSVNSRPGRPRSKGQTSIFRAGKRLGDQKLDTPFTDLDRDQDGRAWARLTSHRWPQHRTVGRPALSDHRDLHRRHPKSHTPTHGTRDRADDLPAQRLPNRQRPDPP